MRKRFIFMTVVVVLSFVAPVSLATAAAYKSADCLSGICSVLASTSLGYMALDDISSGVSFDFANASGGFSWASLTGDKRDLALVTDQNQTRFSSSESGFVVSNSTLTPLVTLSMSDDSYSVNQVGVVAESSDFGFKTYPIFFAGLGVVGAMVRRRRMVF